MPLLALLIGILIFAQGILGIASPSTFVELVGFFQLPLVIYLSALIRFAFGVVLVRAASKSRAPKALLILGILIAIGGIVTPFLGVRFASMVFAWWSDGGPSIVRIWAGAALVIGGFIVFAVAPKKSLPN